MGYFGTFDPKIVSGATTIDFSYSYLLKNDPEYDRAEHKDVINGTRAYFTRGSNPLWVVEWREHLFRYGSETAIATKIQAIEALLFSDVEVYFDVSKISFRDSSGDMVPFYFAEFNLFHLTRSDYKDAAILKFLSTTQVDLAQSVTSEYLADELDEEIVTDGADQIIINE